MTESSISFFGPGGPKNTVDEDSSSRGRIHFPGEGFHFPGEKYSYSRVSLVDESIVCWYLQGKEYHIPGILEWLQVLQGLGEEME